MKSKFKKWAVALTAISTLALVGCGAKESDPNKLKLGVIAGAEAQVAEVAAKVAKEKYGLDVELVIFTDYVIPNAALNDGAIDINAFQHKPFLDDQIASRGFNLTPVGNSFVYPIAGYSYKVKSLDELKDGARIAVPNDPTNLGRTLLLLQKQGLIKLKENAGLDSTLRDIVENPKNLEIVELDAAQLPRALDDVDIAVINNTFASSVNLSAEKDGIFVEDSDSPFVNLIVARADNANDPKIQNFVKAYQTDEVSEAASEIFQGSAVKGWK